MWMANQAAAAGGTMNAPPNSLIANPVVHDKSNGTEDSALCLRANNEIWAGNCSSRRTANPGGLTATQIQNEQFIINRATPGMDADGSSPITGDVNMEEYAKWLKANYGLDIAVGP